MSCDECGGLDLGDVVEHRMNADVVGIVIGFMGSLVILRISPSLDTLSFHEWELRLIEDGLSHEPPAATGDDTNVVKVDFTKRRELNRDTPTGGAA